MSSGEFAIDDAAFTVRVQTGSNRTLDAVQVTALFYMPCHGVHNSFLTRRGRSLNWGLIPQADDGLPSLKASCPIYFYEVESQPKRLIP